MLRLIGAVVDHDETIERSRLLKRKCSLEGTGGTLSDTVIQRKISRFG